MHAKSDSKRTFSTLSPGEILKRSPPRRLPQTPSVSDQREPLEIAGDPFRDDHQAAAWKERGIMLAPLLVTWHYKVTAARPFAKWLRTKEMLLSDARLRIQDATRGTHYFGTYVVDGRGTGNDGKDECLPASKPVDCQTLWGFSDQTSMEHMFELCRGNVERMAIVETDLRDFVMGLRSHIDYADRENFSQQVMITPTAL